MDGPQNVYPFRSYMLLKLYISVCDVLTFCDDIAWIIVVLVIYCFHQ